MAGPRGKGPVSEPPDEPPSAAETAATDEDFEAEVELEEEFADVDDELVDASDSASSVGEPAAEEKSRFAAGEVAPGDIDATRLYLNEIGFSPLLSADE